MDANGSRANVQSLQSFAIAAHQVGIRVFFCYIHPTGITRNASQPSHVNINILLLTPTVRPTTLAFQSQMFACKLRHTVFANPAHRLTPHPSSSVASRTGQSRISQATHRIASYAPYTASVQVESGICDVFFRIFLFSWANGMREWLSILYAECQRLAVWFPISWVSVVLR